MPDARILLNSYAKLLLSHAIHNAKSTANRRLHFAGPVYIQIQ